MKILILDAYHDPEITADTHLENDLVEHLINGGNYVYIITPVPTRGIDDKIRAIYKKKLNEKLCNEMLHIRRFYAPRERKNPLLRAIRYLWCNFAEYLIGKKYDFIDVIYCISTPPTQGLLGAKIKKALSRNGKSVPLIYYLEDIFPDTLVSSGLARQGGALWKVGRWIEKYTYSNCNKIVAISEGGEKNLIEKGVPREKIEIVNNWIDLQNVFYVNRRENELFSLLGLRIDDFIIVYAGNLGESQNVEIIVEAAKMLMKYEKIKFVIFGSGGCEEDIRQAIKDYGCENVLLYPLQSVDKVNQVYSIGDVDLISCKKGFGQSALPSKTWTIMATERPIVASYDVKSDLAEILNSHNCGVLVEAENAKLLSESILQLYLSDKSILNEMGKNGRDYVMSSRDKGQSLRKMYNIISNALIINDK